MTNAVSITLQMQADAEYRAGNIVEAIQLTKTAMKALESPLSREQLQERIDAWTDELLKKKKGKDALNVFVRNLVATDCYSFAGSILERLKTDGKSFTRNEKRQIESLANRVQTMARRIDLRTTGNGDTK